MNLWLRNHPQYVAEPKKATHFYKQTNSYFNIPSDTQQDFWLQYCSSIKDKVNPYLYECVANQETRQLSFDLQIIFERQQVPVRSDIVSTLVQSIDTYVQEIIGVGQTMIGHYFEQSSQGSELIACYLRRDNDSVLRWKNNVVEYMENY